MDAIIYRTVTSATYTPAAERTDDADWLLGAVIYVRFAECDHIAFGNPSMTYKIGSTVPCRQCAKEQS